MIQLQHPTEASVAIADPPVTLPAPAGNAARPWPAESFDRDANKVDQLAAELLDLLDAFLETHRPADAEAALALAGLPTNGKRPETGRHAGIAYRDAVALRGVLALFTECFNANFCVDAAEPDPAADPDALFVAGAMAAAAGRIAAFLALWEDLPGDEASTGCPEWAGDELGALRWTFEAAAARLAGPDELRAGAARLADQLPPFDPAAAAANPAVAVMDLIAACFACRDLCAELAGEDGAGTPWAANLAPVAWIVTSAGGCLANSFRDRDVDAACDRLGDWPANVAPDAG